MKTILRNGTERFRGSLKRRTQDRQRKARSGKVIITISDDEKDEEMQSKEDDWSADLWDDLVKDRPERWNIRDALKPGKSEGRGDPSEGKVYMYLYVCICMYT